MITVIEGTVKKVAARVPARSPGRGGAAPRRGLRHHLFEMAEAVGGGRVDPVDSQIEYPVDGLDRRLIVLRAPCVLPAGAADGSRAESDPGDVKVGIPQPPRLHAVPPLVSVLRPFLF